MEDSCDRRKRRDEAAQLILMQLRHTRTGAGLVGNLYFRSKSYCAAESSSLEANRYTTYDSYEEKKN